MKKTFLVSILGGTIGGFIGAVYAYWRCMVEGAAK